jgi:hypothetical protein
MEYAWLIVGGMMASKEKKTDDVPETKGTPHVEETNKGAPPFEKPPIVENTDKENDFVGETEQEKDVGPPIVE